MKKSLILLLVLMTAAFLTFTSCTEEEKDIPEESATETVAEDLAPDFTVYDGDANKVMLSDFRGTPVVLNFWATWCPPCKAEMPHFDTAYAEYGNHVEFMMVNLTDGQRDTVDGVKGFIADAGYSFPVYFDTTYSAAYAYSVSSIPMTVFINADGTVYTAVTGSLSEEALENYMTEFLAENE